LGGFFVLWTFTESFFQRFSMPLCLREKAVMKKVFFVISLLSISLSAFTCDDSLSLPCDNNEWLQERVNAMKHNTSQKGIIEQYEYEGQVVISINSCVGCADAMTIVYDCTGKELCKFGGIAGFNTCPDFNDAAVFTRVIFESN